MGHPVKMCSNCGDILLIQAKKCPKCGRKGDYLLEIDSDDKEKIQQIRSAAHFTSPNQSTVNPIPHCPKCGSTSITIMKKGFGVGKSLVGGVIAGPVGLLAGGIGANKVKRVCLNCKHTW